MTSSHYPPTWCGIPIPMCILNRIPLELKFYSLHDEQWWQFKGSPIKVENWIIDAILIRVARDIVQEVPGYEHAWCQYEAETKLWRLCPFGRSLGLIDHSYEALTWLHAAAVAASK